MDAGTAAREQEYVCRALEEAVILVAGIDTVTNTLRLSEHPEYSAMRTRLEQAKEKGAAVLVFLRDRHAGG